MPEDYYDDPIGHLMDEAAGRGMSADTLALLYIAVSLRWFVDYYSYAPAQPTGVHQSPEGSGQS